MKKLLFIILSAAILGCIATCFFNLYLHPDVRYFLHAAEISDRWETQIREEAGGAPVYIFAGGSEMRTSVDPQILHDEYGIFAVNAAMAAGFGCRSNMLSALKYARRGDILIASIDINSFIVPNDEGACVAIYRRKAAAFTTTGLGLPWTDFFALFKSHSASVSMYLAKRILTPHLLYRYDQQTRLHPSGLMDIQYTDIQDAPPPSIPNNVAMHLPQASEDFIRFSRDLQQLCREQEIKLWIWRAPQLSNPNLEVAAALNTLALVRLGYKVLKEEHFNISADVRQFSDRTFHCSLKGAVINTHKLAHQIHHPEFWTEEELVHWLRQRGFSQDGTRLQKASF